MHDDRLVGKISPRVGQKRDTLVVEGIHREPDVKPTAVLSKADVAELQDLAAFRGVRNIEYGQALPESWRAQLLTS
ncbi:hypothetical protein [Streptomyces sp. NPDC005125]